MFSAYSAAFWRWPPPQPALAPQDFSVPPSPRVCLQDPRPILGVLADKPGCPACGSWHRGRGQPQPWQGALCLRHLLLAPRAGRVRSYCSGRAGGVLTSAARSGVQASPFTSTVAVAALEQGGSSPGPLKQAGSGRGCCLHCWARRHGSLSSSALVWCLEPGPVSALPNRDLQLANAPRCASVPRGLGGDGCILSPVPKGRCRVCVQPLCLRPPSPTFPTFLGHGADLNALSSSWWGLVQQGLPHGSLQQWVPHRQFGDHWGSYPSPVSPFLIWSGGTVDRRGWGRSPVPLHGAGSPSTTPHPAGSREQWGWEWGSMPGGAPATFVHLNV